MISPEMLRRYSLFAGLDPALFKEIAMLGDEITLEKDEWLFHEDDEADALYLVASGAVELKIQLGQQAAAHFADLSTLVEGDVVGWSALVEPYVYTLSAVAASPATLIRLDAPRLRALMDENSEFGYTLMSRLAGALGERLTHLRVQFVSLVV